MFLADTYSWTDLRETLSYILHCNFNGKLLATLRGSRPGVQSASLIMTSLMT